MKYIKSIKVKNSAFFSDDLKIEFSSRLNCIMGGRGTGKSTLLYFIQSALNNETEEDKKIYSILKNNLSNGTIEIILEDQEEKEYEVLKTINESPQAITVKSKKLVPIESIRDKFDCEIYPALAIEEIGMNSKSRLKLIDQRIKAEIRELMEEILKLQIDLKKNADLKMSENRYLNQKKEQLKSFENADEDFKRHKEEKPDDIKKEEQEEFEKADLNEKIRSAEKRYTKKIVDRLKEISTSIKDSNEEVRMLPVINNDTKNFINQWVIDPIKIEVEKIFTKLESDNNSNIKNIEQSILKINKKVEELDALHAQQHNDFFKLKQKFEKHKEYINKYNQLSKRVDDKKVLQKEITEQEGKTKKYNTYRNQLISVLNSKKIEIFNHRKTVVENLNTELEGSVKITLSYGGITEDYENLLRNALRGSNMRYNAIIPNIVINLTPDKFASAIHNCDYETLKKVMSIDDERSEAIVDALYERPEIYEIESLYCDDLPDFFLKIDERLNPSNKKIENYKKSDELSTGQRCTTVLPIVFAISDNPLIIDQPEDNLDNGYITNTIHHIITEQKSKRQLIFITHNPNIPVLSESEYNLFLNFNEKKSKISAIGSVEDVKSDILRLLEGGIEAFDRRKELYGR